MQCYLEDCHCGLPGPRVPAQETVAVKGLAQVPPGAPYIVQHLVVVCSVVQGRAVQCSAVQCSAMS